MRLDSLRYALPLVLLLAACAPRVPAPPQSFPGFDTQTYPGTERLRTWTEAAPYQWIGYYLPAPCARGTSWVGQRAEIERLGLGIAVLYVGQQTWEDFPEPDLDPTRPIICARQLLTTEQGRADGLDAVRKMEAEGFPRGSVIFLNVERMETLPWSMVRYYRAWQDAVLQDGRYLPGTYAHVRNATALFGHARLAFEAAGRTDLPPFWVAGGSGFSLEALPTDSGLPFAEVWQGALDVHRTWGGIRLQIDENVSRTVYPSAPRPAPLEARR